MKNEMIPNEINAAPAAIRETVEQTQKDAQHAAEALLDRSVRRIFLIGNGTSLYSAMAAGYTARQLARAEQIQVFPWAAGDFRFYTPELHRDDAVIGISASGEFRDVLEVFERLDGQHLSVGITQVPGSTLTRLADFSLIAGGGLSQVAVMTKTYASTLTAAHLLMLALYQAPGKYLDDLTASADRCAAGIAAAKRLCPEILPEIASFELAYHFGAGPAFAAALETALKMREMAMMHAVGLETWEMASGSSMVIGERTLCVALSCGGHGDESTTQLAAQAKSWGAPVLEIGPEKRTGDWHLPVAPPVYEPFASLSLVPPAALLAYWFARGRGYQPDYPDWRERYLDLGMTHFTGKIQG